ncbi:hypothetical protein F4780DRAFT_757666 [Xylariomycetidae sp. FL0641]|nr:hypothetical protein F4780DRAFT_757666 [Xylariomycetidae sp. FL0641]
MSDPNILVSNGTCYSAAGEELDGSFIPCGNDAFGHQTCCGAGDNCLADNACFGIHGEGYGSFLTYLAGCTDSDYEAATCPQKEFDQPWIALTLCDDSGGEWAPCSQEGDPTTLQPGAFCSCTDASKTTVYVSDATTLSNIASLPESSGQSISFFAGYTPSGSPTATATPEGSSTKASDTTATDTGSGTTHTDTPASSKTGTGSSNSGTSSSGSDPSSTNTSDTSGGSSGLNQGAKIGIGVGVAVGVLLMVIALVAFILLRRRRRQHVPAVAEAPTSDKPGIPEPRAPEADSQALAEVDGRAAHPWTMRRELEGAMGPARPAGGRKVFKPYRKDPDEPEMDGQEILEADGRTVTPSRLRTDSRNMRSGPIAELPGTERWPSR